MKMKRVLSLLITLSIISVMVVSCSNNSDNTTDSNAVSGDPNTSETIEETTESSDDDLPELNYDGYEFNIYTRENFTFYTHVIEEQTGEVLNDSVYMRTRNVEERLNVLLKEVTYTDANAPRALMLAGDNSFDMYNSRCSHALNFWVEGLTVMIDDLPYLDLTKPYWNDTANESISINKQQYVAIGAANIGAYDFLFSLLFNKKMIADLNLENPYDLVNTGAWTIDKMDEMMRKALSDLNGDGIYDAEDSYGYASSASAPLPGFWIGSGLHAVAKDADDIPYFAVGEERFINLFNKVFEITWDSNAWFKTKDNLNVPDTSIDLFMSDRTLFMDVHLFYLERLRNMETDFGIIPYPKWNENQKEYFSRCGTYDAFVVSKSNEDLERTSAVIEALNSESYKTVFPNYYELCLKTRNARDNESEKMLDLVFNRMVIDLGDTIWMGILRDGVFLTMFRDNNRDIVSKLESMSGSIQAEIDKVMNAE